MPLKRSFEFSVSSNIFKIPGSWTALTLLLLLIVAAAGPAGADDAVTLSIETRGAYDLGPGDSRALGRKLALFRARRAAAERAADRFARKDLIQFVDRDRDELVDLVADGLQSKILEDHCPAGGSSTACTVRTLTTVHLSDFIRAELTSLRLGTAEKEAGYRDEMAPRIPDHLEPGQVLARVRRLIDQKELRMAVIYLDRLTDRYPNWREIYEAKAAALRLQNRPDRMRRALNKACELGSPKACSELKQ